MLANGVKWFYCFCAILPQLCLMDATDKSIISVIADQYAYRFSQNRTHASASSSSSSNFTPSSNTTTSPLNGTGCTTGVHEPAVAATVGLVLVFIALATAGGNFMVILAVLLVKKLRTPSNILIVSLAFSDFLVGILVLPFSIFEVVQGYWSFNEGLCDMFISFDVLLCTASILNLCAISIDRYLVITRPLTYISRRTPWRMGQMIAAAWVISALISIPPNFGWKPPYTECKCEYSKDVGYQIYATFCAFYLPLIVMIVLYGRIFKLAREMSRTEQRHLTAHSPDEATAEKSPDCHSYFNMVATNECVMDPLNEDIELKNPGTMAVSKQHANPDHLHHENRENTETVITNGDKPTARGERGIGAQNSTGYSDRGISFSLQQYHSSTGEVNPRRTKNNSDTKVIKTLGVIMGCFCLCWLPFFMMQLLLALLKASGREEENPVPQSVFRFLLWLGYINSFLNPFIYAKFNLEFRTPFKLILLCRCHNINARIRSAAFSAQYGLSMGDTSRHTGHSTPAAVSRFDRRSRFGSITSCPRASEVSGRPRPPSRLRAYESSEANVK